MRPLRVLFGAVPTGLLAEFREAIGPRTDVEVVGVVERPTALLVEAGALRADVVVVAWIGRDVPGITSHLLDQYPHIRVVAVRPDGRRAIVSMMRPHVEHLAVPSAAELVRVLRDGPDA